MWTIYRALICAVILCTYTAAMALDDFIPNDFYYNTYQWYSTKMDMPEAWGYSTGSSSVKVAVLDTGVISTIPDLSGRILSPLSAVPGQDPFPDDWLGDPTPGVNPTRRHGTWVASAIAMGINNSIGGAGMGNFSILPIRIAETTLNTQDAWLADGIRMAADNGAKVINISYLADDYGLLDTAAAYVRGKGALTFIASGNSNFSRSIADYANLIFVAGTDINDERWSQWMNIGGVDALYGSSYGSYVDIAAPAGGKHGVTDEGILVADPTTLNGYGLISGTSFSTALASGAAALAWSINPNLTPDQVQQMLYDTAVDLDAAGRDIYFGYGRVNVGAMAQTAYQSIVPEPSVWILLVSGAMVLIGCRRRAEG